jgi:uncharacterized damage-inducible protein DinB
MTYYGGKELAASFRTVRGNTIQIAEEIPESAFDFQPSPDTRTVRRLLAHIAFLPMFSLEFHPKRLTDLKDVDFPALMQRLGAEEAMPRSKAELIALLKSQGEIYASYLEGLVDDVLAERVVMPPGAVPSTKTRFEMLLAPKEHEMHHRAQLMLIQRMLGLVPHLTRQMQERMQARQVQR